MRSSRINLQEDLRHILEEEAKLDNDVWMLLQVMSLLLFPLTAAVDPPHLYVRIA